KIQVLKHFAQWFYRHIATVTGVALSTVYWIAHPPLTPIRKDIRGRHSILRSSQREKLITLATASVENRCKPYMEIAKMAGFGVCGRTLHCTMASSGYHRRVAPKKPFLSTKTRRVSLLFSLVGSQEVSTDWCKVIWTDECTFNVGYALGRVWITRRVDKEFEESCLLHKFKKLESILVWGCFVGRRKGPLLVWDKAA
ncbi:hypothetical protein C7212DRAFT_186130, partial [Tuber magnatum]